MIIFTKQLIEDKDKLINSLDKEIELINHFINQQKTFINYQENQNDFSENNLNISQDSISSLENLVNLLNEMKNMDSETLLNRLKEFNSKLFETNSFILKNNVRILKKSEENLTEDLKSLKENTLIISEKEKKVFLPFNLEHIQNLLKNNPTKYSNIHDVVEKNYTLPISNFSTPSISRFKEAFKLMRTKQNGTFKESLDLATELFFNYNLHPAIIYACNNLDELDIYLDYLQNNETEKFSCFKIEYEALPTVIKSKKNKNELPF